MHLDGLEFPGSTDTRFLSGRELDKTTTVCALGTDRASLVPEGVATGTSILFVVLGSDSRRSNIGLVPEEFMSYLQYRAMIDVIIRCLRRVTRASA